MFQNISPEDRRKVLFWTRLSQRLSGLALFLLVAPFVIGFLLFAAFVIWLLFVL